MAQAKPRSKNKPKVEQAVAVAPRRWTYEDYCAIPDDGQRYEIIGGELIVAPVLESGHAKILFELTIVLAAFIERYVVGEIQVHPNGLLLVSGGIVQPALLFVRTEHLDMIKENYVQGTPDLVVEVLSDSTAANDRSIKRDLYAASGIPFYWIIAPRTQSLEEYELAEGTYRLRQRVADDETFTPAIFPELSFSVRQLWQ